ncbi:MAG: tautomerase family protein [Bacillota bacterium]|nr:tautomerase family protein [Bacillota bacterium]
MPLVNVYYQEGLLNQGELNSVSQSIHHSLMEEFNVPEKDYFHVFLPYAPGHFFYDRHYFLESGKVRSDKMIHIAITCGPGRTVEQKKKLYQLIADALYKQVNIPTTDVFITLNETPIEDWSFGQGLINPMVN